MKLTKLRQLLKDYEQTWYIRKYIYGDHDDAIKIRQYLKTFENESADYELTASDIFRLIKIIPINSNLQLIQSIKSEFSSNYFFEIFEVMDSSGIVNENNFSIIYGLSYEGRYFLYNLFCYPLSKPITLSPEVFETVLTMSCNLPYSREKIEQCLRLLDRKNHLTHTRLSLINENANQAHSLFQILQELDKVNCLNETSLSHLGNQKSLSSIESLLSLLNRAKITINDELIKLICTNNNLHYLVEISSILIESKEYCLTVETFTMLLKQEFTFFLEKNSILKLLQQNNMLDSKAFDYVCNNDVYSFGQILKILSAESLLKNNQELIGKLLNKEFDAYRFYRAISLLKKADLLDIKSLDLCIKLILLKPQRDSFRSDVFDLFNLLDQANFNIKKEMLEPFFSLTESNIQRLNGMVSNLIASKLLDHNTLEKALQRVIEKLPLVLESTAVKKSRKNTSSPKSEIILDSKNHFFTEHSKQYESGGFGKVKKGYSSADTHIPLYGVKKLAESDLIKAQQEATREVKYHRLLGRQAFYFSNKSRTSIVAEWQHEKGLHLFNSSELIQVSFEKRLLCLTSGLSDLNTLHNHYRVHGDVKCQNFVIDLKNSTMKLIDFGTSHKRGSSKSFAWTPHYLDPHTFGDHFCKDLYAMGIVTMCLFPELYTVTFDKGKTDVSVNKSIFTTAEQAVVNLVNSMMHPSHSVRCTSEDALTYCSKLINNFDNLDGMILKQISSISINRSNTTSEDVLRGVIRASI
ncbi:MAG: protein kinase family protein [Legionella sp.]|uniref:protein kinase domain-containing protein n=1 Tax=Legionella sp. TaxID=459 RepID=UPI0039E55B01